MSNNQHGNGAHPSAEDEDMEDEEEEESELEGSLTSSQQHAQDLIDEEFEDINEPPEQRMQRLHRSTFTGVEANSDFWQFEIDVMLPQLKERCAICLEPFDRQYKVPAKMPGCEHVFCAICSIKSTRDTEECPYCYENSKVQVWQLVLIDLELAEDDEAEEYLHLG